MLSKRLIVCLDVREGKLAKSIQFVDTKDIGDPVEKARQYYEDGVDELVFYSDYHFKTEEQYMKDIGYDDIDRHIKLHDTFRQKLTEFKQNKQLGEHDLCHELLLYLSKWLMHHVMEEDKKVGHKS